MVPAVVVRATTAYLRAADRLLPGRVVGCYIVGSVALDAYRDGRSDIDVLAVLDDEQVSRADVRRLRLLHVSQVPRLLGRVVTGSGLSATCDVSFVRRRDLTLPVTTIQPVASHTGHEFRVAEAFDVNPVMWQILAARGIAVRGPAPDALGLDPEPAVLRAWNLNNLRDYWSARADALERRSRSRGRFATSSQIAWCVLGPLRLHATIATGEVVSKEAAGTYGRGALDDRWAALIDYALTDVRGERPPVPRADHVAQTIALMRHVIADAERLAGSAAGER